MVIQTSKYIDRVGTNVICSLKLKQAALERGITLSTTLEEALEMKLALPNDRALIEEKIENITTELNLLKNQLEVIETKRKEEEQELLNKQRIKDREIVRSHWKPTLPESFNKALRMFAEKYDTPYDHAYKEVMK